MATIPTHMLLGGAIGLWFGAPAQWRRVVVLGACCAAVLDLDWVVTAPPEVVATTPSSNDSR